MPGFQNRVKIPPVSRTTMIMCFKPSCPIQLWNFFQVTDFFHFPPISCYDKVEVLSRKFAWDQKTPTLLKKKFYQQFNLTIEVPIDAPISIENSVSDILNL